MVFLSIYHQESLKVLHLELIQQQLFLLLLLLLEKHKQNKNRKPQSGQNHIIIYKYFNA